MNENTKKITAKKWLLLSLILIFVGFIGASVIQTNFGRVEYTKLNFETESGHTMSALLLVPKTATPDTPAPCIVTVHGWYNNKEMQDLNYVEYARRGYVVLSVDQLGHGDSDNIDVGFDNISGNGVYDAVKMVSRLPYVDTSRIGITGHSYGAESCKAAVARDNETDLRLIAACLLVNADSNYTVNNPMYNAPRCVYDPYSDESGFYNFWGSRDVGIVAAQYDEFYHGFPDSESSVGYTSPRDYIHQPTAQSFLYFGIDPKGMEERQAYTNYTQEINGEECFHVIYNPPIIHPKSHWSPSVVKSSIEFFDASLDNPVDIASGNQIWIIKCAFNTLSLIGFFMFVVSFALMLLKIPFFSSLAADREVVPLEAPQKTGKFWYWGGMVLCMLFGMITYLKLHDPVQNLYPNLYDSTYHGFSPFFSQFPVLFIGLWSALCGIFLIIIMLLYYHTYGKKHGYNLWERGIAIKGGSLIKTILLSVIVVACAFLLVFIGDWLLLTDCRIWVLTVRAFGAEKFAVMWKYFPFFSIYYVALSLSVNGFNYVKTAKPWVNTLTQCLSVAMGPTILLVLQYGWFHATGLMFTETYKICGSIVGIWLLPIVVYLPLGVLICRLIYKKTANPYIGGIIMALLMTVINCTNTLTFA